MIHTPGFHTGPQSASVNERRQRFWSRPPLWNWWHSKTSRHSAYQKSGNASVTGPPRLPHTQGRMRVRDREHGYGGLKGKRKTDGRNESSTRNRVLLCQKKNNNSNTPAFPALQKNVYLFNSYTAMLLTTPRKKLVWSFWLPCSPWEPCIERAVSFGEQAVWGPASPGTETLLAWVSPATQGLPVNRCTEGESGLRECKGMAGGKD